MFMSIYIYSSPLNKTKQGIHASCTRYKPCLDFDLGLPHNLLPTSILDREKTRSRSRISKRATFIQDYALVMGESKLSHVFQAHHLRERQHRCPPQPPTAGRTLRLGVANVSYQPRDRPAPPLSEATRPPSPRIPSEKRPSHESSPSTPPHPAL